MMMRSDQEIPFPRTQDTGVSKTWGWGQNVEKTGQGEQGWGNKARKGSKSVWLSLPFFKISKEWVEEK